MKNIEIRGCQKSDLSGVFSLVKQLAEYEKLPHEVKVDLGYYEQAFEAQNFECIVAVNGSQVLGTCIYYETFSTWKGKMLHLEDFVVKDDQRGKGIGKLLFEEFLKISKEKKCKLVKWQVIHWNKPAINFYKKYDVVFDKEWWDCKIFY